MSRHSRWVSFAAAWLISFSVTPATAQPTIVFDYTYDTNNFFPAGSQQRTTLEFAANLLTSRMTDSLTAITPSGGNTWDAVFFNPSNLTQNVTLPNLTIAANEIRVFAGGQPLGGSTLGVGGPGGWGATGFEQSWFDTIAARGQVGALGPAITQTDFGPWGGAITFDSDRSNWHFGLNAPSAGQSDFLSVAVHELGHLLGFGTADSWDNLISGTTYNGPAGNSLTGGPWRTTADKGHWVDGTTYLGQEAAMDPSILQGTRKLFTELDYAGLDDLGWQITPVPEPASVLGVVVGLAGVGGAIRRFRRRSESVTTAC